MHTVAALDLGGNLVIVITYKFKRAVHYRVTINKKL